MTYFLTAIISDLHANTPALRVAIHDALDRGARRFVCLGDVIGYGAHPTQCLDWVMALIKGQVPEEFARDGLDGLEPGLCLLGNHEQALLHSAEDFNPKARAALDWTRESLTAGPDKERGYAYWDFVGELVPSQTDERAMFAHGSPRDPVREYLLPRDIRNQEKMSACFAAMTREVCFVGHSHVPAVYYEDGRLFRPRGTDGPYALGTSANHKAIVNVGAVGQPRDGDPRLSYVLFDGDTLTFVRLEYDIEAAAGHIRAVPDLPEYLAERLLVGR